jgi:hypothetical protein
MKVRRLISFALIASLMLAAAPLTAWAADEPTPAPGLGASIDRAVAQAVVAQAVVTRQPILSGRATKAHASASGQAGSGGGGGKGMMVMALVGTIAGLAGTYYVVKEMKKTTNPGQ